MTVRNALALGAAIALMNGAPLLAETPATPPTPQSVPHGIADFHKAAAGAYKLDGQHTALLARVSHVDFSWSVVRFTGVEGDLTWDPAKPTQSTLKVTVKAASIQTGAPDFSKDLMGDNGVKADAHPDITFVSKSFTMTDPTHGKVTGDLTLAGKTKSVTLDVTLVGANTFFGQQRMGVHAETALKAADFGLSPFFEKPIQIVIDTEFYSGEMKF